MISTRPMRTRGYDIVMPALIVRVLGVFLVSYVAFTAIAITVMALVEWLFNVG